MQIFVKNLLGNTILLEVKFSGYLNNNWPDLTDVGRALFDSERALTRCGVGARIAGVGPVSVVDSSCLTTSRQAD